jgi:hypothetical protein
MPRKQRFKPNRKKLVPQETQASAADSSSQAKGSADARPGLPGSTRREVHPDDIEIGGD